MSDQITIEELQRMFPRVSRATLEANRDHPAVQCMVEAERSAGKPVDLEGKLHNAIIEFCDHQWPVWKYIHARMDKKATIGKGVQDFTIFAPGGRVLCVECKARNEKPDDDQLAWACQMRMLGHIVHCIRSWQEFEQLVKGEAK